MYVVSSWSIVHALDGATVVDLGCGYGWFCRFARTKGAAEVLGLVRGIMVIPYVLLAPLAGSAADRYSRKAQLMIAQLSNVLADATQVEQALLNLCTNAMHAIGTDKCTITLGCEGRLSPVGYTSDGTTLLGADDKAGIAKLGASLEVDYAQTWSCYKGGAIHCGTCGTCVERREAFILAGLPDPTLYEQTPALPDLPYRE